MRAALLWHGKWHGKSLWCRQCFALRIAAAGRASPMRARSRANSKAPNMERLQERCILLPILLGRISWKRFLDLGLTFSVTTVDKPEGDGSA
jgi:hypothetical protein